MQRRQLLRTSGKALAAAAGAGALSACTIRRAEHNRSSGLPQVRARRCLLVLLQERNNHPWHRTSRTIQRVHKGIAVTTLLIGPGLDREGE